MSGFVTTAISGLLGQLRPASFRGIPFGVRGGGKALGRRIVTHRFPLRDTVTHEDMGRLERSFTVEAFLVGADLITRLKRLEAALETQGAGRLVHPHYGSLDVVVTAAKVAWSEARDLAQISITCEQYDPPAPQPAGQVNSGSLVDRLGLSSIAALVDEYSSLLTLDGLQDFVTSQLGAQLGGLGIGIGDIAAVYGFAQQVRSAVAGLLSWIDTGSDPGTSAAVVTEAIAALGVASVAGSTPDALLRVAAAGVPAPAIASDTPSKRAALSNAQALDMLVRGTAAAEAARSAAVVDFSSRDSALAYRDQVTAAIDDAADLAGAMGWDASWRGLMDLRAATVTHITRTAAPLPRVTSATPAETTSSLLLAYQIDGNTLVTLEDRAADIVRRNRVAHPGFLPGGAALEVLTDG
ncbi:hypothetical protein GXW78_26850 [Roseomonas terrae]|uniref:DNA circulation N-terminal domain-containing protein n=1 Tax=Neoroseomonas terrae TaxID=424799 RepID=A0ABS5EQJ7_9PROT|nr:DNA circularization N-terminal domain-containing protein [Neoroseomonas terrae]MBR0653301.1 hypothetical protein [Neoroseomonas terrae]